MEREHARPRPNAARERRAAPPPPAPDVLAAARAAAAQAPEAAAIAVVVRTTSARTGGVVRAAATPDTPVAEVFARACQELGIEDRERYQLVANGEVLGDGALAIGALARETTGDELVMRLVRRPEAGERLACPCSG